MAVMHMKSSVCQYDVTVKTGMYCMCSVPPKHSTAECAEAPLQMLTAARSRCAETVIWVGMRPRWVSAGSVEAAAESSELWDCGIVSD